MTWNKKYLSITIFVYFCVHLSYGQEARSFDSLVVKCFIKRIIENSNDLNIRIKLINSSNSGLLVYREIYFGSLSRKSGAIDFEVQKKIKTTYKIYLERSHIDLNPATDSIAILEMVDSLKDDREKYELLKSDSIIAFFRLNRLYFFEPGRYRVRCFYRYDLRSHIINKSKWIYFKVNRTIYVSHEN
jgi:hypothetical protein